MLRTSAVAIGALLLAADPAVKKLGNAIVEFRDPLIQVVIAYEYSHRFHSDGWLMIDLAVRTKEDLTFQRTDFTLTTPDKRRIPLASQERFLASARTINSIRQNAGVWKRDLSSYFVDRIVQRFQLFVLPTERTVSANIATNSRGPALLTIYFESPEPQWKEGGYRLTIDNGPARATLPIELK